MTEESIIKPIYQQIAIDVANRVFNGEFAIGTKIHGRSTLAGEYNVSPETIRRAIILLQDMDIVDVHAGSGIVVKSRDNAYTFIEKFKCIDAVNLFKNDIANIMEEKRKLEDDLQTYIERLIDHSERFKNSNPFAPIEIEISENSSIIGKTISEVKFWQETGATIIGIRRDNKIILSPGPYATFMKDDVFIMIGELGFYQKIEQFFASTKI